MRPQTSELKPCLKLLSVGLCLVAAMVGWTPANAETLALLDGQRIETKGPWTLDGRRITYTAANGTFSAIRASLVDLEKSRELSNPRQVEDIRVEPAKPEPVGLVVRQSDVRRATKQPTGEAAESGPTVAPGELGVSAWSEDLVAEGTKLNGTLMNRSQNTYLALRLDVTLLADNGDELATRTASLEKNWADADESLGFVVNFPDVFAYSNARFSVEGKPFQRPTPTETQPLGTDPLPGDTVDPQPTDTDQDPPPGR